MIKTTSFELAGSSSKRSVSTFILVMSLSSCNKHDIGAAKSKESGLYVSVLLGGCNASNKVLSRLSISPPPTVMKPGDPGRNIKISISARVYILSEMTGK